MHILKKIFHRLSDPRASHMVFRRLLRRFCPCKKFVHIQGRAQGHPLAFPPPAVYPLDCFSAIAFSVSVQVFHANLQGNSAQFGDGPAAVNGDKSRIKVTDQMIGKTRPTDYTATEFKKEVTMKILEAWAPPAGIWGPWVKIGNIIDGPLTYKVEFETISTDPSTFDAEIQYFPGSTHKNDIIIGKGSHTFTAGICVCIQKYVSEVILQGK